MNIYLSPEAIEAAETAYDMEIDGFPSEFRKAAYRALIQYIVDNPRELSQKERTRLHSTWALGSSDKNQDAQASFNESLRIAFTPPTPDVPEKIVELIDRHIGSCLNESLTDHVRELAVACYEAGMAQSKGGAA